MQCVWCFLMSGCCCAGVRCHSLKYQFLRVYANKRIEDLHKLLLGTLLQIFKEHEEDMKPQIKRL